MEVGVAAQSDVGRHPHPQVLLSYYEVWLRVRLVNVDRIAWGQGDVGYWNDLCMDRLADIEHLTLLFYGYD